MLQNLGVSEGKLTQQIRSEKRQKSTEPKSCKELVQPAGTGKKFSTALTVISVY